jgi:hypothetical protein
MEFDWSGNPTLERLVAMSLLGADHLKGHNLNGHTQITQYSQHVSSSHPSLTFQNKRQQNKLA